MFDIQNRRYIGNKFKLMDWISELIDKNCEKCHSFFGRKRIHWLNKCVVWDNIDEGVWL